MSVFEVNHWVSGWGYSVAIKNETRKWTQYSSNHVATMALLPSSEAISEHLIFEKIFWGSMPPDLPRLTYLRMYI